MTWPVLAVIAVGVKLTSPGPIFFRQERLGLAGESFRIRKFRTMTACNTGPAVTAGGDARVTPFGRVLRRTKLDELPQLLNVLAGEMSFVGPRPEVPEFAELFPREYARVLRVRPGITHPGTLLFRREEQILAEADDARAFYVERLLPAKIAAYEGSLAANLWGDVQTIVQTILPFLAVEAFGPADFDLVPRPAAVTAPAPAPLPVVAPAPAAVAAHASHAAARVAAWTPHAPQAPAVVLAAESAGDEIWAVATSVANIPPFGDLMPFRAGDTRREGQPAAEPARERLRTVATA